MKRKHARNRGGGEFEERTGRTAVAILASVGFVVSAPGCADQDREEQESYQTGDAAGIPTYESERAKPPSQGRPDTPAEVPPDQLFAPDPVFDEVRGVYVTTAAQKLDELESRLRTGDDVGIADRAELETWIGRLRNDLQMLNQTPQEQWEEAQRRFNADLNRLRSEVYAVAGEPPEDRIGASGGSPDGSASS